MKFDLEWLRKSYNICLHDMRNFEYLLQFDILITIIQMLLVKKLPFGSYFSFSRITHLLSIKINVMCLENFAYSIKIQLLKLFPFTLSAGSGRISYEYIMITRITSPDVLMRHIIPKWLIENWLKRILFEKLLKFWENLIK